ncbi:MAG: VOC family protein [Candidatus Krumholzibacteria bacterium]|nr:VOC family protein [Candidatus Krumholzibacteria bacterium]
MYGHAKPAKGSCPEHSVHYLEIVTEDAQAACDFYTALHGWKFRETGPEMGGSYVTELPDGSLCGIRAPMHEQEKPIVRVYVRVKDIDAAVKRAQELGAQIALEPNEIPGHGKVAIYFQGGIEQGLWQVS